MNIQAVISYMFVKRGFMGLLALTWGFMLGGSLLMTTITYALALAGINRFSVTLCQLLALAMVLSVAWKIMEGEYQTRSVTNTKTFGAAFLVALLFSAIMPVLVVVGAVITGREAFQKYVPKVTARQRQSGLTGFLQDLMNQSFLKLAH